MVICDEPDTLIEVICAMPGMMANWRLQRLRHGTGHRLGTGARVFHINDDGREVDAWQRSDRKQRISGQPDQHQGRYEQ